MKLPALFSACLSLLVLGCSAPPADSAKATEATPAPTSAPESVDIRGLISQPAPPYEFVFSDGGQKKSTDFNGKTVLLSFFATWDVTSKPVAAQLQKWQEAYGKNGLVIIGVNTFEVTDPAADKNRKIVESAEASAAFAKAEKLTFPLASYGDATAQRWSIGGVPAFVLITKDGMLKAVETNAKPETMASLEQAIAKDCPAK